MNFNSFEIWIVNSEGGGDGDGGLVVGGDGAAGKQFKLELWYKSFRWYIKHFPKKRKSTARIPKKQQKMWCTIEIFLYI